MFIFCWVSIVSYMHRDVYWKAYHAIEVKKACPRNLDSVHWLNVVSVDHVHESCLPYTLEDEYFLCPDCHVFVPRLPYVEHTCIQFVLSMKIVIVIFMLWSCDVMEGKGRGWGLKRNITVLLWFPKINLDKPPKCNTFSLWVFYA